jgi:hypothetical protein
VLCEAYALTHDLELKRAAQQAIEFIVYAQHAQGGWRYAPGEPGDTSIVGWQLMALRSARMARLEVPDHVFQKAARYLDRAQDDSLGATYAYQPGRPPTATMTAEALLCRQYLGWPINHSGLKLGIDTLLEQHPPNASRPNIYYWYYATQVMHHMGGDAWNSWNAKMPGVLLAMQESEGHQAGSWAPKGGAIGDHDAKVGGRIYMTSLAICILEVYYRHLPLYRAVAVEPRTVSATSGR